MEIPQVVVRTTEWNQHVKFAKETDKLILFQYFQAMETVFRMDTGLRLPPPLLMVLHQMVMETVTKMGTAEVMVNLMVFLVATYLHPLVMVLP